MIDRILQSIEDPIRRRSRSMGRKAERFKRVISVRNIIPTRSHLTPNLQKKIYVSPFCMLELPATNTRPKVMSKIRVV